MSAAYVYIMTNKRNTVVYVGVTSDLVRRTAEHKAGLGCQFTAKYNCDKLVYFESGTDITGAIQREKQIKNRNRAWKNDLINQMNPTWQDLSESIGVTADVVDNLRRERLRGLSNSDRYGDPASGRMTSGDSAALSS